MSVISYRVNGAEIREEEDGPVLICSAESPFGNEEDIGYRFSFVPEEDGLLVAEIMIFLFNGIAEDRVSSINTLINKLDPYITLGCFRYFDDTRSVIFSQGALLYDDLGIAQITNIIGKTLVIMEETAFNAGEYIFRCLNGEEPETLLAELK